MTLQVSARVSFPDTAVTRRPSVSAATVGPSARTATTGPSASAAASPLARILVQQIPDLSPPTIDSREAMPDELSPSLQGTLAISFGSDSDPGANPPDSADSAYSGPQRPSSSALPEPQAWVTHMAQALIEVMSGARPAPQVIRWTTPEVYSAIARRNVASGRRTMVTRPAFVRRVRICEPVDGVIEACAVVVDNGRVRALAMRLTDVDRRWVVSALQVG